MIRLKCPTCARALGIDVGYAGQLALCPGCQATFTVPVPAMLLEEIVPAALSGPPLDPLVFHAPAESSGPLLPEGPIGLAPDPAPAPQLSAAPAPAPSLPPGLVGLDLSLDSPAPPLPDPWALDETRRLARSAAPSAVPTRSTPPPLPPEPAVAGTPPQPPAQGPHHVTEADLVGLAPVPAAPPPVQGPYQITDADLIDLGPGPAPASPQPAPAQGTDWRLLTLEPPDAARDLPAALVGLAPPAVAPPPPLPPPLPAPPALLGSAELAGPTLGGTVTVPVAITPGAGGPDPYALAPQAPAAQPDTLARREAFLPVPAVKGKRKKARHEGSMIPGVDDFYLGLGVLGVIWLVLVVVVVLAPALFWLPILVGLTVWGSAAVRVRLSLQDDDPLRWLKVGLVPMMVIARGVASRKGVGWVAVGMAGLVMILTGVLALVLTRSHDPGLHPGGHPPVPFVQPGP